MTIRLKHPTVQAQSVDGAAPVFKRRLEELPLRQIQRRCYMFWQLYVL